MFSFRLDYFILVTAAYFGVLQIVAARYRIRALSFFENHRLKAYLFGAAITVGAFLWFFYSADRNVEGKVSRVEGAQQFTYFFLGVSLSVMVSLLLNSLLRLRSKPPTGGARWGLEALRRATYLQALLSAFKRKE